MNTDLAALVGSRICHDLISPIGAISNGVELLSLTEGDTSAEMDLISQSVQNANARIRFFRIAFGAAASDQVIGSSDVQSVLNEINLGGRMKYQWLIDADQPRQVVRCAFLLMLCLETALPLGGEVTISLQGDAVTLKAIGRRVTVEQPLWDSLKSTQSDFAHQASQVQFALLPAGLAEAGRKLHTSFAENHIMLLF